MCIRDSIRIERADRFDHIQSALSWMEDLCGNLGMGEDLWWVLRRGLFEGAQPYPSENTVAHNQARRSVLRAPRVEDVPSVTLKAIEAHRADHLERQKQATELLATVVRSVQAQKSSAAEG